MSITYIHRRPSSFTRAYTWLGKAALIGLAFFWVAALSFYLTVTLAIHCATDARVGGLVLIVVMAVWMGVR